MHVVTVSAAATQQNRHNAIVQLFLFVRFNEQKSKNIRLSIIITNIDGTLF